MLALAFDGVDKVICQPHPNFFRNANQKNELYRRNQWQLRAYIGLILTHIPSTALARMDSEAYYYFMVFTLVNFFFFLCFCRTRVWIYHFFYTISMTTMQVALICLKKEYIIYALTGAFLTPSLILVVTQSLRLCCLGFIGQIALLHIKYRNMLHETIREFDEEEFSHRITNSIILILTLITLAFCLAHQQLKTSKHHIENECSRLNLFIQTFSHELRNPLNILLGNIELALRQTLSSDTTEVIESAKVSGELLLQLVNNILDSGKENLEVSLTSSSMGEALIKVWRISKDLIKKKQLNGFLKIDKKLPPLLQIDPYRMTQILLNLLNNAVKFTEKGYIWTTLEWIPNERVSDKCFRPLPYDEEGLFEKNENMKTLSRDSDDPEFFSYVNSKKNDFKNLKLNCHDSQESGVIKIIIKDTGCGIKKDDLHKVFGKFIQVHDDPCQRKIGSGLGLFITKQICEQMGGEIRVYSKEGQGTTFIACIPSKCASPCRNSPLMNDIMNETSNLQIQALIIDNNLASLNILSTFVSQINRIVAAKAENCFDAFERYIHLRKNRTFPQVVLLDIDSPILDGKSICRKIREYEIIQKLNPAKIVLITEARQSAQIEDFLDQAGQYRADAVLKKPLSFEGFAQVIGDVVA